MAEKVLRERSKGGRPPKINEKTKDKVVKLYNDGLSGTEISHKVKMPKSSVYRILSERR